jgi:aspartate/methionine/tyrosine aminotransferase
MKFSQRLQALSHNVFADMDRAKARARASGQEIIDLSLGSADLPTAPHILESIAASLQDPQTHGYLLHDGTRLFRQAAANWYLGRFGVPVDAETEVLQLIGSQEGTAHLPLAILDRGDFALLLDPGYPSHAGGVYLAGGQIYGMPLTAENRFLPIFSDIPPEIATKAKMMVLSYPHNPTTATAPLAFFVEALDFCRQQDLVLVHDFPYADLVFGSKTDAPSILQADREKERSIEFFTFSKSYNMGGFRLGFAIGNAKLIGALRQIKAVVDFNQYLGILNGGIAALTGSQESIEQSVAIYRQRRDLFVKELGRLGWHVAKPQATMYIWAKLPEPWQDKSREFATQLVAATGVAVASGAGFGKMGEGYVRFALVREPEVLAEAAARIGVFLGWSR